MSKPAVYLAGPISGKDYASVMCYIEKTAARLEEMGYEILHPMLGKSYLRTELEFRAHGYENPVSTNHAIFERDRWMVARCDIVLAQLQDAFDRVSIGTVMELAWASMLGKHTIVIIGAPANIHRHAFILEAADIVFDTLQEAFDYLRDLIGEKGG